MALRSAIIGCGKRASGFVKAGLEAGDVEFVGFADPTASAAARLVEEFGGKAFADTKEMLAATKPEFVCIVTRPSVRLEPVTLCAEAGVRAVLCEKPMSDSWGTAVAVRAVAEKTGMLLTFCHQRRLLDSAVQTKRLMEEGAVGEIERLEGSCSNLYDWGTHWFDMCEYLVGDADATWILAQAERREPRIVFDQPMDNLGVSVVRYANDATAVIVTGKAAQKDAFVCVRGSAGEIRLNSDAGQDAITLVNKDGISHPAYDNGTFGSGFEIAVLDTIRCLREGTPSLLDSANALRATEQIFASYLSSQRGERVDLPLAREGLDLPLAGFFG